MLLGEFYSAPASSWLSCGSSWHSLWSYQSHCFDWPPGQFLDLNTMTWVTEWDSDTQISITDPQLDDVPLWRSFIYYVDYSSEGVTELGTYDLPYKELQSVFVELMNFHSHSDRTITIKVNEGTTNYILDGTYVLNTTSVVIETYSKIFDDPGRATVTFVQLAFAVVPPPNPTKYKILSKNDWFVDLML